MEQGQVVAGQRHFVVQVDAALVDGVESGDRHPQFADALLRVEFVRVPADSPAVVDRPHCDADAAVERPAEFIDTVADILGRGNGPRCGMRNCARLRRSLDRRAHGWFG